jgi:hypothetical protein
MLLKSGIFPESAGNLIILFFASCPAWLHLIMAEGVT